MEDSDTDKDLIAEIIVKIGYHKSKYLSLRVRYYFIGNAELPEYAGSLW